MNCKFCNAELEEGMSLCPVCGKEQTIPEETPAEPQADVPEIIPAEENEATELNSEEASGENTEPSIEEKTDTEKQPEQKEERKTAPGKIALAVIAIVVVLAALIALVVGGMDGSEETVQTPTAQTVPTEETVPVEIPFDGNPESYLCKASYTVSDEEAAAQKDVVVATMGDVQLTNGQLQVYYWMEVAAFLNEYSSYASFLGLDYTKPLDTQICDVDTEITSWEQFFLDSALQTWKTYQTMALEGQANGHEMTLEHREYVESLAQDMEETAKAAGLSGAQELVESSVGPGSSVEDYVNYVKTYYGGYSYYNTLIEAIETTQDQVIAYYEEFEEDYTQNGVTKDAGKYVDVRHVLLQPKNGEVGEDGYPVFSDEEWEICREKAQELYDQWKSGDLSEESFAQLAIENSEDGNAAAGGLYQGVYEGYMVETFNDWCFDEARQVGDHGLVKTQYGYHIMFFSGSSDIWYATAEADLFNSIAAEIIPATIEKYPAVIDFSKIVLGQIKMN